MRVCTGACVCTCERVCVCMLRIVSTDKILCFINTIVIIHKVQAHPKPRSVARFLQAENVNWCLGLKHTLSAAFWHLPPNSARIGYSTEGALFMSAQLSTDAVSAL